MRRMRIACWTPKGTNTHSEYVIIIALPLQQWLHGRPTMLRYTYIDCLVYLFVNMEVRCDYENSTYVKNKKPTRCHLLILFYFLETQHVSGINMPIFRSMRLYCWSRQPGYHPNSNTQQTKNETANVLVRQYSRLLLNMGILMHETCWVSKK